MFCESGNERSAVVVAAYIMQHLGVSTIQAIQIVQHKRFCVCLDDAMKWMLSTYEYIWPARQQFYGVDSADAKGKRRMEEDEDEDEIHSGRAPFTDEGGNDADEMMV